MMLGGFAVQTVCDMPNSLGDCMDCPRPRDCLNKLVKTLTPGECMVQSTKNAQELQSVRHPEERMVRQLYQTLLEGQCPPARVNNETYYIPDALPNWVWALVILYVLYSLNSH